MIWLSLLLTLIILFEVILRYRLVRFNKKMLKNFPHSRLTDRYDAAAPQYFFPERHYDKAVLLLHGFSTSAQDFEFFCNNLKQKGIPYNALTLTGYGLTNFNILRVIHFKDWLREALDAYDELAMHAEKIHVVGNSFGALLGAVLAMYRPVDKFMAINPAFFVARNARFVMHLFNIPILNKLLKLFFPYYVKKKAANRLHLMDILDSELVAETFNFAIVPTNVLATFDQAYKMLNLKKIQVKAFYLFTAVHDQVVKNERTRKLLKKCGITYQEFSYKNSAHVLVRDFDRHEVAEEMTRVVEGD